MTFLEKDLERISFDMSDEWQHHEDGKCSVMVNGLEDYALRFYGITDLKAQYPDGWVDAYVSIIPAARRVESVLFVLVSNDGGEDDHRELEVHITNVPEGKRFFRKLAEAAEAAGGLGFAEFIEDCAAPARPQEMAA